MFTRRFGQWIRRCCGDRRGATTVYVAATIIPLVGFLGVATDISRAYLLKAKLGQALDSAGLAAAQSVGDAAQVQADVTKYFDTNFPSTFMNATINGPNHAVSGGNDKVTVDATATIDTTFMRIFGIDTVTVAASTEVTRKSVMMDIVLSIDMSGSMNDPAGGGSGVSRIEAARNAANILVDRLYGTEETKPLLKIGLVPWNSWVNVTDGSSYSYPGTSQSVSSFVNPRTGSNQTTLWTTNNSQTIPFLSNPPSGWQGCVRARYIHDGDEDNNADDDLGYPTAAPPAGGVWKGWEPVKDSHCLDHGITPLQQSKSAIKAEINALTSPEWGTNIPQGLVWAYRVVKSDAPFTQADPNPIGDRYSIIVLLSDGENWGANNDGYAVEYPSDDDNVFGNCTCAGPNGMDDRLRRIATNAKNDNVIIYVIQFAFAGSALQTLLEDDVATQDSDPPADKPNGPYYYFAPDEDALNAVFTEIANNLAQLHLSK